MRSLAELQQRFARSLAAPEGAPPEFDVAGSSSPSERMDIYRRAVRANYRNALGATYPVVLRLVGESAFSVAVDAFVRAHPSASGDLNDYGDAFGAFFAQHPSTATLPYLPDVARLEWAIDEVNRATDETCKPEQILEALAAVVPERLPGSRLRLTPRCRLVGSGYPILQIWQKNQAGCSGDLRVSPEAPGDTLCVRRDPDGIVIERLPAGDFAWLAALGEGTKLAAAIDAARSADADFDLGRALHAQIGNGTIAAIGIE
jgi:hypothetical protein